MWNRAIVLAGLIMLGITTGCAARGAYAAGCVRLPPPAPRVEVYSAAPGPGYVWIGGFWDWRGGGYVWTPGYWTRPPRPHARWVPGRWSPRHGGYCYERGYWR